MLPLFPVLVGVRNTLSLWRFYHTGSGFGFLEFRPSAEYRCNRLPQQGNRLALRRHIGRQARASLGPEFDRQSNSRLRECCLKSRSQNRKEGGNLTRTSTQADTGKVELRRDLSRVESFATIVGILIGSGIFVVTGKSALVAGPSVPLAYLALAPVVLSTAMAYVVYVSTPLGTRPGDAYLHISRTLQSYYLGFIALWLKWLAYIGALVILSTSLGQYLKFFLPNIDAQVASVLPFGQALLRSYPSDPTLGEAVIATGAVLFFLVLNLAGVKVYGRLQTTLVIILCLAIAVLVIPGLLAIDFKNFSPLFPYGVLPHVENGAARGFLAALPPLFFSYAGYEALAQTAGETKESQRSLPLVFIYGLFIGMTVFFLMSTVAFGVMPHQELAQSKYAMADAASRFLPAWGGAIVAIGALTSFCTCLNATLFVPSRILYVFGEDRLAPQAFAKLGQRSRIPWVSLVINTVVALVLLWTRTFGFVLNVSLVAMFILYGLHSGSLVALPFVRPELYKKARVRPRPWVLVLSGTVSVVSMTYLMIVSLSGGVWKLLLAWVAIGTVFYLLARWEGKRSNYDYKRQLVADWIDE
jgi:APA family basic amino acid/polyamine antiporter